MRIMQDCLLIFQYALCIRIFETHVTFWLSLSFSLILHVMNKDDHMYIYIYTFIYK